jgi:putative DNA primase/helicase
VPFHLPRLKAAPMDEVILILEGEKDVKRAERLGFTATTTHGGAKALAKSAAELAAAVKGRKVAIIPDADDPGDHYAADARKAVIGSASSVVIITLPGLVHGQDLSDWLDKGHPAGELYTLIAEAIPVDFSHSTSSDERDGGDDEEADSKENKGRGPSQGTLLVQMVVNLPGATLFHTAQGESFASVSVNGHIETWPIHSASFKRWLRNLYYTQCDTSPGEQGVTEARATLEGIALYQGEEKPVSIRLAEHEGDI